jgi:hypothetical protein
VKGEMSIPGSSQFNYTVVVNRTSSGAFRGRATPGGDNARHPGLVGDQPHVELTDGVVNLYRSESAVHALDEHHGSERCRALRASFRVGEALDAIVEDGDVLRVSRGGTTDLAATLFRHDDLLMGLGAVGGRRLGPRITVEVDPRAGDMWWNHLAATLAREDTTLVWLDSSDASSESKLSTLPFAPGVRLVIAIAGTNQDERRRLHQRLSAVLRPMQAFERVDVDGRFKTRDEWVEYVQRLPKTRPLDLYIRFGLDGALHDVHEGEYAFTTPWHLFVEKVFTPGIPGEWSQMAVAREHPRVTEEMIVDSTKAIASRRIDIVR